MGLLMKSSRSNSTEKKYSYAFKSWANFALQHNGSPIPSNPQLVAMYLTERIGLGASHQAIITIIYAVKWFNELQGLEFNHQHPFIRNVSEASKRLPTQRVQRKDVVSTNSII
jgi:alpha-D-ribose 1-methylphosphonate 5-phosphate C-P lyase